MNHTDMASWEAGFINSNRGHYILAQALVIAIEELEKVPGAMKEVSNIQDMHYLLDNYFDTYQQVLSDEWVSSKARRRADFLSNMATKALREVAELESD